MLNDHPASHPPHLIPPPPKINSFQYDFHEQANAVELLGEDPMLPLFATFDFPLGSYLRPENFGQFVHPCAQQSYYFLNDFLVGLFVGFHIQNLLTSLGHEYDVFYRL